MQSTVFDFTVRLSSSDNLRFIRDSVFIFIEYDAIICSISDRKDFSLSSQFSLLASGQDASSYLSFSDYCDENIDECGTQEAYRGVFLWTMLFDLSIDIRAIKPEYLMRDSVFIDVLKLRGYEDWGYLSLDTYRAVRGEAFINIIDPSTFMSGLVHNMSSKFSPIELSRFTIPSPNNEKTTFTATKGRISYVSDFRYVSLARSWDGGDEFVGFAEICANCGDIIIPMSTIVIHSNFGDILDDALFHSVEVSATLYSYTSLNSFICNSAIIPYRLKTTRDFISKNIDMEVS
jgi:hypothetical protein